MEYKDIERMFSRMPVLDTERLTMRKMQISDTYDMYDYACNEEVTKYLLWQPHGSPEYTKKYLQSVQSQYRKGRIYDWAVVLKENNKMIGTCGFASIDFDSMTGEVGYVINPKYWGSGFAPEALRKIMEFGFYTLELQRIEARYIKENERSRRVMEKCGMEFEGINRSSMLIKGRLCDIGTCAILKNEFT